MRKSARWITALAVAATFACAEAVAQRPQQASRAGKSPVSVFIDGAYIRAVPGYQSRHFEIAMGRVVAQGRAPRQFAGAPNIATGKHDIVRAAMRAQGWLPGRDVTVFSDGEVGLKSIVLSATRQPVTADQQARAVLFRARERIVHQRTELVNGHCKLNALRPATVHIRFVQAA